MWKVPASKNKPSSELGEAQLAQASTLLISMNIYDL